MVIRDAKWVTDFRKMTRIGFIGAGKMAQALARGLINSGRYKADNIIASSPKTDVHLLEECKALGINTTFDNTEVSHNSDVLFVAVKPQHVSKVASEVAPTFRREQLLVSIALGITIRYIETLLPTKSRVVRVMPNTPAVVGAGASAYSMGSACLDGDSKVVHDLLSTVGFAVEVPEIHIDPVTGLSGSGPSYVSCSTCNTFSYFPFQMFAVIEGLADGGVKMGLPRDLSIKLASHCLLGAAKMVLETGEHPAILKEAVQSPGGSSAYGIHELERGGMRALLTNAVESASIRAKTIGDQLLPRSSMYRNTEL